MGTRAHCLTNALCFFFVFCCGHDSSFLARKEGLCCRHWELKSWQNELTALGGVQNLRGELTPLPKFDSPSKKNNTPT